MPANDLQEELRKCPKCQEEIKVGATKCKHCNTDLRNWFSRHKILTAILMLFVIGIVIDATGSLKDGNTTVTVSETTAPQEVKEEEPKITKEACDKVKSGMSREQVISILGEPSLSSESEIEGIGKSEMLQFQESFSLKGCTVMFSNGKVFSKTRTEL